MHFVLGGGDESTSATKCKQTFASTTAQGEDKSPAMEEPWGRVRALRSERNVRNPRALVTYCGSMLSVRVLVVVVVCVCMYL